MNSEFEVFKLVNEYRGKNVFYKVSNFGSVKSYIKNKVEFKKSYKNYKGYYQIKLQNKYGFQVNTHVHRLVASAFIENDDPENKTLVNHKDVNTSNHHVKLKLNKTDKGITFKVVNSNLEWCTLSYNNTYADAVDKRRIARFKNKEPQS